MLTGLLDSVRKNPLFSNFATHSMKVWPLLHQHSRIASDKKPLVPTGDRSCLFRGQCHNHHNRTAYKTVQSAHQHQKVMICVVLLLFQFFLIRKIAGPKQYYNGCSYLLLHEACLWHWTQLPSWLHMKQRPIVWHGTWSCYMTAHRDLHVIFH